MEHGFVMQILTVLSILRLYNKNELQNKADSQNEIQFISVIRKRTRKRI